MEYQSIKSWPEDERPRERLLKFGADELSTAQLMAIILRTGGRKKSAIELARELLTEFGSVKEIEAASLAEFSKVKGIGSAKLAQLKAAFELGRRLMSSEAQEGSGKPSFKKSSDVFDYYRPKFYGLKKERFLCALLDTKNRIFKETVVSEGTLTSSLVHPREVFRSAIKEASASVLFVHNHPSGDTTPSRDDITITERLVETGKIVGIEVLDHIIIADGGYMSLFEKGYIQK
ncbi:MAG: DNA repair protein RadC [Nitrospirae bacterium]|nr:DNA repair protein RadC [Nitrospirota bacterium]